MKHLQLRIAVMVVGACLIAHGLSFGQNLDVKTGQWMWTITMSGAGTPPPGIPPAMAAKILEEMKRPRTVPGCVSAEDLRNFNVGKVDDEDECTVTSRKSTATTADFVRSCKGDMPHTETVHLEVASREAMRLTAKMTGGPASEMLMLGKWTGATCKED